MNFKFVSSGQSVADAPVFEQIIHGNSLKPLAPVHLIGSRNSAGDLTIEWQRRARIAGGMRPLVDVPLAEEKEVYSIEIYNGSTLLRTLTVTINRADGEAARWTVASGTGITSDDEGSVTFTNQSGDAIARSQAITGDFIAEVGARPDNVNIPADIYIVPQGHLLDGAGPRLYIARSLGMTNDAITITDGAFPISATDDTDATAPARFFFVRKGTTVSIYRNNYWETSHPIYVSSKIHEGAVYLAVDNSGNIAETTAKTAYRSRLYHAENRRLVIYTANQQTEDFGSAQSSIKVRIYQVSQYVGRGAYAEATL